MRLSFKVSGNLKRELEKSGLALQDAANAAVLRQTDETKGAMRVQIAQRLSARSANALRSRQFVNSSSVGQGDVAGFIFSGWWRKSRRGGEDIDMFKAFEDGAVIAPARGQALAIPLPAAYDVVGGRSGSKRPTPLSVEAALDTDLFVIKRPGKAAILAAKAIRRTAKRGASRFVAKRYRNKKGALSVRRAAAEIIPLFVLLRNTRLPKRLDFSQIQQDGERGLGEKLLVEIARREPG